jgi:hypothetical protein
MGAVMAEAGGLALFFAAAMGAALVRLARADRGQPKPTPSDPFPTPWPPPGPTACPDARTASRPTTGRRI